MVRSISQRLLVPLHVTLTAAFGLGCGGDGGSSGSTQPPPPPPPPPPPTQLAFTVQPTTSAAGTLTPAVQVTARTAQGNTATQFTGSVTIALGTNPTGTTLSGTPTVTAVAGVATFSNLIIARAGNGYGLTADASGLTSATSSAFNITPGPAASLVFTVQPASATAGIAIAPAVQVTARDAQGNTATGFIGAVSIALGINPTGATLSTTNTAVALAGIATFSSLSIDRAGTGYTLTATATGLTSATSAPFSITAAANTTLLYLSPLLQFKLRTTATANSGAGVELCLSTMEWTATLAGDMVGTSYAFNFGVKTAFTSSGTGTLRAEIIHKRGSAETVLATTTFTTTSTYGVQRATLTGPDPTAQAGDVMLLRIRIVPPSPGLPCIAEFSGPATDNYIEIPRATIQ